MIQQLKKLALLLPFGIMAFHCHAQEEDGKGFNPNRLFIGGSIGLGLGFGSTVSNWSVGLYPQVGYSFTNWLDAGVAINTLYNAQKWDYSGGNNTIVERYRTFTYGTGVFARAFPFRSFFVQVQPELNWISYKYEPPNQTAQKGTVNAESLLVGVGFGNRSVGQSGFFTTIMIDVLSNPNSPYRNFNGNGIVPVIRAGFVYYLNQKKQDRYLDNSSDRSNRL